MGNKREHQVPQSIAGHKFIPRLLPAFPRCCDGGAHEGEFLIPFLVQHGGTGIAFEPYPPAAEICIQKATAADVASQITIFETAMFQTIQSRPFYIYPKQTESCSLFSRESRSSRHDPFLGTSRSGQAVLKPYGPKNAITCKTISLDTILAEQGHIDLLKLDIEGAEWEVLMQTPTNRLAQVQQISVELHMEMSGRRSVSDLMRHLKGAGFHLQIAGYGTMRPELWGYL